MAYATLNEGSMVFTDKFIKSLKAEEKKFYKREKDGFTIRVMPSGVKTWLYVYTFEGKRKEMNLGQYRDDGAGVSLADAKRRHREALILFENGKDPATLAAAEKDERLNALTVAKLVEEYLSRHAEKFKRSWQEDKRILNRDIIPAWGKRKTEDIKKRDINLLLENIVDRGAPVMANNTFKIVRRMFNYAVEKDILPYSPAAGVKLPSPKIERDRTLSEEEVKTLWQSLDSPDLAGSQSVRRALRIVLITAQRPGEVAGLHTSEIDGNWWIIPADRSKNGKTHRVFLTPMAQEIINQAIEEVKAAREIPADTEYSGYVFPCPHKSKDKAINRPALSHAIVNNCPSGCVNNCEKCNNDECKADGKKLSEKNLMRIAHFTPHDLRRTAATFMAQSGEMDEVIDAVLNHVKQGVIKVYNQYRYDREKQAALEAWERKLNQIIGGKKADNVRSITMAKSKRKAA